MLHQVARAAPGRLLFTSWREGADLWARVALACEGADMLVLMPDHVHLLHARDARRALAQALAGHMRARNHAQGRSAPGVQPLPEPEAVADAQKERRTLRYVALNPCRAGLVNDPLAWPLSTYRDAVGLALRPLRAAAPDPWALHAYVSADPSVDVRGTLLPEQRPRAPTPDAVAEAVCGLLRVPRPALERRGPDRDLYLACARALCAVGPAAIGEAIGVSRQTVYRAADVDAGDLHRVSRVIGDPRFFAPPDGDLRLIRAWARYRGRR